MNKEWKPYKIICQYCGCENYSHYKTKKYCSVKCRNLAQTGKPIIKKCLNCDKEFNARELRRGSKRALDKNYCSRKCMSQYRAKTHNGSNHHGWKGGIFEWGGYLRKHIYLGNGRSENHHLHRVIMEEHLGRKLTTDEVVHHIDRNKKNNDISNLQVMTWSEHSKLHAREDKRK